MDQVRARLLSSAFRMPSPPTMISRKSTITNAFVCAIIPVVPPTPEEIKEALRIVDFERIVGSEAWRAYWERLEAVDRTLAECQACAVELARAIAAGRHGVMRTGNDSGPLFGAR